MTTKKSMIFLISLVLISITIMSTYYFDRNNPTNLNDRSAEGAIDPDDDETSSDNERDQLKVAVAMDTDEYLKLVALSLEFETYHHGMKVEVELIDEQDVYTYYKRALQMGDAPDIMLLDNAWINEFAALSYLAQLDEVVSGNMNELQIAPMVAQAKWNGLLWAIPKEVDPYVLVWNADRLSQYSVNDMPETVDEWLAINYILSQDEEEEIGFYLDFSDPYAFLSTVWLLEGQVELEDVNEGQAEHIVEETLHKLEALLYPEKFEDFKFMTMSADGEAALPTDEVTIQEANGNDANGEAEVTESDEANYMINEMWLQEDFNSWELLNDGTIAMMVTKWSDYNKYADEHIKMTALPLANDLDEINIPGTGSWLYGKSFAVSSKSEHQKEAFNWIQSITTADAQIDMMNSGGGLPAMISAYGDRLKSTANYDEIVKAIERGHVFETDPELPAKLISLRARLGEFGLNEIALRDVFIQTSPEEEEEEEVEEEEDTVD